MFKTDNKYIQVFDVEWIPDSELGRRLFELPKETQYFDVLKQIQEEGGADKKSSALP